MKVKVSYLRVAGYASCFQELHLTGRWRIEQRGEERHLYLEADVIEEKPIWKYGFFSNKLIGHEKYTSTRWYHEDSVQYTIEYDIQECGGVK